MHKHAAYDHLESHIIQYTFPQGADGYDAISHSDKLLHSLKLLRLSRYAYHLLPRYGFQFLLNYNLGRKFGFILK
jgi:hypothetical protein